MTASYLVIPGAALAIVLILFAYLWSITKPASNRHD